jgi:hypothetical protein
MKTKAQALHDFDWNFDAVPDSELVACCYWEYARESEFIRGLRQRSWEYWKPLYLKGQWWTEPDEMSLHKDLQRAQSIGYPAEVFMLGMACPPDGVLPDAPRLKPGEVHKATGSFPKPWQALTTAERLYRSHIGTDVERIPLVPFRRGISMYAQDILDWVKTQHANAEEARGRVRREHPQFNEETLLRLGKLKFPDIKPSVYWAGGREVTIVAIDWGSFTNDEIVNNFRQWVKVNRPEQYRSPNRKGHKPKDWRANLTRLAVMRLLSQFTPLGIVNPGLNKLPAIWKTKQFGGRKWYDVTKWYDARREAGKLFGKLFPFLPENERPISWERRVPGK